MAVRVGLEERRLLRHEAGEMPHGEPAVIPRAGCFWRLKHRGRAYVWCTSAAAAGVGRAFATMV